MLILARRIGESLEVGDDVRVTVLAIKGNQVRIGIDAPTQVAVHREEVHRRVTAAANNLTAKADTCGTAKLIEHCDLCGQRFQYGPNGGLGTYVPAYQVMACNSCYAANRDGWALHLEEAVTRSLKAKGLRTPERNTKGLLPRDGL